MVRPRSVTTSPDPQLSAYFLHFPRGFFRVLTGFFPGFFRVLTRFLKNLEKNLVQFSPTPSMADPLWRSPIYKCPANNRTIGIAKVNRLTLFKYRRAAAQGRLANPDTLAFKLLARTPTRKRFPHSRVYECNFNGIFSTR